MSVPYCGLTFDVGNEDTYADSNSWTTYANIKGSDLPQNKCDDDEITTAASADCAREYVAGLAEGGEAKLTLIYSEDDALAIAALFRVNKGFRVMFSDGSGQGFTGYVNSYGPQGDLGSHLEQVVTVKVSGLVVEIPSGT